MSQRATSALQWWLTVLVPVLVLFCLGAATDIRVPGPYMDAINPDYIAVGLLHPQAQFESWALPSPALFGRFPLLIQVYHGALPLYLGLPVYLTAGTGIIGIRLANMLFGLLVLLAAVTFLRSFRVAPIIALLCLSGLALDPGFVFGFRTQFYITLLPLAPLLASLALVEHRHNRPGHWTGPLAGLLAGIACYGYFIFFFLSPWNLVQLRARRSGSTIGWLAGFAVGVLPYPAVLLLMLVDAGSVTGFRHVVATHLHMLSPDLPSLSLIGRLHYLARLVLWTVQDVGAPTMMLHHAMPSLLPWLKILPLLVLPALLLVPNLLDRRRLTGSGLLFLLFLGFVCLVLTFGDRLWLHHMAPLLPLLYLALALSLDDLVRWLTPRHALSAGLVLLATLPLIAGNLSDQHAVRRLLRATGGVGLASDALIHVAEDSRRDPIPTEAFLPDWGVFMPFVMITGGHIPAHSDFTSQAAYRALCSGRDVLLVLVGSRPVDHATIDGAAPVIVRYRQRDGVPVLEAIRWHGGNRPGRCPGPAQGSP